MLFTEKRQHRSINSQSHTTDIAGLATSVVFSPPVYPNATEHGAAVAHAAPFASYCVRLLRIDSALRSE